MILSAIAERLKRRSKDDFKGRHFEALLILQAVSWYLRYPLSYRDIEELFRERGLMVDHATLNRWVLAYSPLIERRLRAFCKPHCGSIRIDETYIKIRGQWRYLYRAVDKHGTSVDFLLTATRDLEAAKRFFRKMLKDQALARARSDRHGRGRPLPAGHCGRPERRAPAARTPALRQQTPAAGDRERSLPGQEVHAADRRLSILLHGTTDDPGVRSHAVAAEGFRILGRVDGVRAEPDARVLLRSPAGS
jgi:DDE domain